MSFDKIAERAMTIVEGQTALTKTLVEVLGDEGHKQFDWHDDVNQNRDLGTIGELKFGGTVSAAIHLTRTDVPPLDSFEGEPDEDRFAYTTIELQGSASAAVGGTVANNVTFGFKAGARARYAHHLQHLQSATVGEAVGLLLDRRGHPYDPDLASRIREHEVMAVEFEGNAAVNLAAGWKYGLTRKIEDIESFEKLDLDDDLAFRLEATLAATFRAGLSGRMKVVVSRSESRADHVRVQLLKRSDAFVGAGIDLTAGLQFLDPDKWTDEVLEKALELPDHLIADACELQGRIVAVQKKLGSLKVDAKAKLETALNENLDRIGVAHLEKLVAQRDRLRALVGDALDPLVFSHAEQVLERLNDARADLIGHVDGAFGKAQEPIESLRGKLSAWIGAYDNFREQVKSNLAERIKKGLSAEIAAGINRTRVREALLDLDFHLAHEDPHVAQGIRSAYHAAVLGDFNEALILGRVDGSHGVEINGGSLKKTVAVRRNLGVKLNLFGIVAVNTLNSWKELTVNEGLDGSLGFVAKAGAKRYTQFKEDIETVSFLFDLHGAARRDHGREYFDNADIAASFERSAMFTEKSEIQLLIPLHLDGARELGLIDAVQRDALEATLLAARGDYGYELALGFPRDAVERVFILDTPGASEKFIRSWVWGVFKTALNRLDIILPSDPAKPCPMSLLVSDGRIEEITRDPQTRFGGVVAQAQGLGYRVFQTAELPFWNYMKEVHYFIGALLATRERLIDDAPGEKLLKSLRRFSGLVRKRSANQRSVDAKYLMLAELGGLRSENIKLTLRRGDREITV